MLLTANPDFGYKFAYWTIDGATSTANPLAISMTSDHTVVAHFTDGQTPLYPRRHNSDSDDHEEDDHEVDDYRGYRYFRNYRHPFLIRYDNEYDRDYDNDYEFELERDD